MDTEIIANYLETILISEQLQDNREKFKVTDIVREESMLTIHIEKEGVEDEFYIFVVQNKKYRK